MTREQKKEKIMRILDPTAFDLNRLVTTRGKNSIGHIFVRRCAAAIKADRILDAIK